MEEPLKKEQFAGVVLSYGRVPRLNRSVKSLGDIDVFVFNPLKSWWSEDMKDYTAEVLENDIDIIQSDWKSETEVRNAMIEFIHRAGYRAMIMIDADEELENVDAVILGIADEPFATAYTCNLVDFGPDGDRLPPRSHKPVIAVDTRRLISIFTDKRCVNAALRHLETNLLHYSYDVPEEYQYKLRKEDGDIWPPQEHAGVIR